MVDKMIIGLCCKKELIEDIFLQISPEIVHSRATVSFGKLPKSFGNYRNQCFGIANILNSAYKNPNTKVVIVITDKCYENEEWTFPYRENDKLGGMISTAAKSLCRTYY